MESNRLTEILNFVKKPADRAIGAVYGYFEERHEMSRYLGLSFVTQESRKRYFEQITQRWKGDEDRIERIIERTLIGRTLRINFWRYFFLSLSMIYGLSQYHISHPLAAFAYSISFYVFVHLAFLYSLERDNNRLAMEIHEMIGRKKRIRDAQKKVSVTLNSEVYQFSLQDILTIEYFLWKAKEGSDLISFSYPVNSQVIEDKIYKKWGIRKSSAFAKLIASSAKGSFGFLSYNLEKSNRKINTVNGKLESIINYLADKNYLMAKGTIEDFYGMKM
jgi:hypothetical protein